MREPSDAQPTDTVAPEEVRPWPGPSRLAPGALIAGRYEIHDVLGSGGTAIVYRAFDRLIKRPIALKVLRPERLTANALVRLRREATAARDVVHPHLIHVFDLEAADDLMFLAMELVEGETLRERLKRGALPVDEALRIATAVLQGLAALHAAGLLHRDVKPGNVLLAANGEVKLADLGLVRRWGSDETRATESEAVIGTFEYLSPEQAMGEELDIRSDLYSLGVVLYEMLAGRLPHAGKSSLGTLLASLRQPVPDVKSLRPEAPAWLAEVVSRLLAREPAARFGSAGEVLDAFDARRARRRPGKVARRAAIAVTALAGAVAIALAIVAWLDAKARGFAAIVSEGTSSARAVDTKGRTLWRRDDVKTARNFLPIRRTPNGAFWIGALPGSPDNAPTPQRQRLELLDPVSGRIESVLTLPGTGMFFEGYSDFFGRRLTVFDVDGDGADEALVTFVHDPFWPSYTVLCEPAIGRCQHLLVASGHHAPVAVADVDRDGRNEVLFAGFANRMGHFTALAAVRPRPWVGDPARGPHAEGLANTPDRTWDRPDLGALAWYCLLPPATHGVGPEGVRVDARAGEIVVTTPLGPELRVGFDGFRGSDASDLSGARRGAARERAYESLRDAERLRAVGRREQALAAARSARDQSSAAGDSILLEWSTRQVGRSLVESDRHTEAAELFEDLQSHAVAPDGVSWEAGRAFHLAGQLERAATWYRRGLDAKKQLQRGVFGRELLDGLVLSLVELGRWEEALGELATWRSAFDALKEHSAILEAWIGWRLGRSPDPARLIVAPFDPDFHQYVALELRLARGVDGPSALRELDRIRRRASEHLPLLLSYESELLRTLGQLDQARTTAREALVRARAEAGRNFYVRAHLGLIEGRARRLGG